MGRVHEPAVGPMRARKLRPDNAVIPVSSSPRTSERATSTVRSSCSARRSRTFCTTLHSIPARRSSSANRTSRAMICRRSRRCRRGSRRSEPEEPEPWEPIHHNRGRENLIHRGARRAARARSSISTSWKTSPRMATIQACGEAGSVPASTSRRRPASSRWRRKRSASMRASTDSSRAPVTCSMTGGVPSMPGA